MSTVHDLKIWPLQLDAVVGGSKRYEWRRNDRNFEIGDVLRLREWNPTPAGGFYTDRAPVLAEITYITRGPDFGVPEGFAILGIRVLQ